MDRKYVNILIYSIHNIGTEGKGRQRRKAAKIVSCEPQMDVKWKEETRKGSLVIFFRLIPFNFLRFLKI